MTSANSHYCLNETGAYTRKDALNIGVLIDISDTAKEAGFVLPVAVTLGLWTDIERIQPRFEWQDARTRFWEILMAGRFVARANNSDGDTVVYPVTIPTIGDDVFDYAVKLVCHSGDCGEPVVTLMRTNEG